jgi:Arylsulfotransferase (ASST)/Secretion system C-terminal sorting domain
MRFYLAVALALLIAISFSTSTFAIEVAVPSDFPAWTYVDNDTLNQGYYWSSCSEIVDAWDIERVYSFAFDARGNLAWYWAPPKGITGHNSIHHWDGRFVHGMRYDNRDFYYEIHDPAGNVLRTVDHTNPWEEDVNTTWHQAVLMDDGTLYTVWRRTEIVDMTPYGGLVDCEAGHNVIQKWDADDNLLWEWSSGDHVDMLPYDARYDVEDILEDSFNHLHINAFQVLPDGDLLVNSRTMNMVFRVDGTTGDIEWRLGGVPPFDLSDFTYTTNLTLPEDVGIHFTDGHDCNLLANGTTFTYFDNGNDFDEPHADRAYARRYELDFDNWTAELTWYHFHPDEFPSAITGSYHPTSNGNHMIGWGGGRGTTPGDRPTVNAEEVTDAGDVVFGLTLDYGGLGIAPKTFRVYKFDTFPFTGDPSISYVEHLNTNQIEVVCNWFGHEEEVFSYDVYVALEEGEFMMAGNTGDGTYMFDDVIGVQPYWFQAEPLDESGVSLGTMSNVIFIQGEASGLALTPQVTEIPGVGGNVVYGAHVVNATTDFMPGLTYQTEVVLPNGNTYGPLLEVQFTLFPYMDIEVSSLNLAVGAFAPNGDYTFVANVLQADTVLWSDSFGFSKGAVAAAGGDFGVDANTFISGGDLSPFYGEKTVASESMLPSSYHMTAAYPNPFNPTTTITVALPEAADLQVAVFNVAGQLVATLADGRTQAGIQTMTFDASGMASGLYFVRATVPGHLNSVQKVMLVR